ncbi:MAG TPA: ABC-F family ATP-binding cassette domain-containing protein [Allosphingosinicella sp.]|nr:ABC-F family ATP-binding cassette domain-containing protein [Allosphingosinicella sp.]
MSFLTFDCLAAAAPDGRLLFSDLSLSIGRERIGLVGRNGAGKSTLLAIAAGEARPAAGHVIRAGRIGVLRQIQPSDGTLAAALGVAGALARLERLTQGEGSAEDMAEADWTLAERLDAALADVGLPGADLGRDAASLSGGERTRLGLARLLVEAPDLLLLDEPTNNLDREGRAAVAALLADWRGGALVASHDRRLLEGMDRIVHLSAAGIFTYGGGWSAFAAAREAALGRAGAALESAERALVQEKRAAQARTERQARRDRAGRAAAARGGAPKIILGGLKRKAEESAGRGRVLGERQIGEAEEALATARAKVEILTPLRIELPASGLPANRTLLAFEEVALDLGGRRLFGPLSFTIRGPERLALSGPNGAGKTSLLKLVTGALAPTSGTVRRAEGAIAMLDQHVAGLDPALDLVGKLRHHHPALTANHAHAALARFGFRNREALRPAGSYSGGERLRAGLAIAFSGPQPPQLLILDEPTNHLDVESIEMLEAALGDYDGALLVVSHDAAFLDAIGVTREIGLG